MLFRLNWSSIVDKTVILTNKSDVLEENISRFTATPPIISPTHTVCNIPVLSCCLCTGKFDEKISSRRFCVNQLLTFSSDGIDYFVFRMEKVKQYNI